MHLASCMPFERAAQMMEAVLGVQVSEATVRRHTEEAGAHSEAVQTMQAQAPEQTEPKGSVSARQAISADGACVPLLKGQWAEVRTVARGSVEQQRTAKGEQEVHVGQLSYFSRLTDAATFADLAEAETRRRGVRQTKAVCAVTDGADWRPRFIDLHRPDAVRILDFPHAAEHLSALAEALAQAGVSLPPKALQRSLHLLKYRGPGLLLRWLDRLPSQVAQQEGVREHLHSSRQARGLDAVPTLSTRGMAHRFWHGRERQQARGRSSDHSGRNALGADTCQSHVSSADRRL